jgi:hypothetical protein
MSEHPIQDAISERLEEDTPTKVRNDLILYLVDLNNHEEAWLDNAEKRLVKKLS